MGPTAISLSPKLIWHPSPNFNARRGVVGPSLIVLHYTAMDSAGAALERLCDPEHEVSAHYLIAQCGTLYQMVRDGDRAWHAGAGSWGGQGDVNSRSIGIELCNPGTRAFPAAQIAALTALLAHLRARWNIPAQGVIGHSDLAPDRKSDPGPWFPWAELVAAGHAVDAQPVDAQPGRDDTGGDFWEHAYRFGYGREFGKDAVLRAYQMRFRPGHLGKPVGPDDYRLMAALAERYPVDGGA